MGVGDKWTRRVILHLNNNEENTIENWIGSNQNKQPQQQQKSRQKAMNAKEFSQSAQKNQKECFRIVSNTHSYKKLRSNERALNKKLETNHQSTKMEKKIREFFWFSCFFCISLGISTKQSLFVPFVKTLRHTKVENCRQISI